MLRALAEAGAVLNRPDFLAAATRNAEFLLEAMRRPDGALHRTWKPGHTARLNGYLEDHANVADGTQWVLWIRQGDRERASYFNNHFPGPIVRFARELDEIIAQSVGPKLRWERVLPWNSREHEKELWKSTER